jgi:hypothetical protein
MDKNKKQIEDPILSQIQREINSLKTLSDESSIEEPVKKGTNRLLWDAPVYSAVGIDMENENIENPNAYWQNWAKEQEKLNKDIK